MGKFNTPNHRTQPAVVRATTRLGTTSRTAPDTRTHEGAAGWAKDSRTDLLLRTTSSFLGGEKSFYEDGATRDQKAIDLVRQLAVEDFDWVIQLLTWLRGPGNVRTAPLMLAPEAVDARLKAGLTGGIQVVTDKTNWNICGSNRQLIASVLQRPDEPGEMLAYWAANHGRAIPQPIKRGIADAVRRLYSERSLLKYDTATKGYRFGDILNLVHAAPAPDKPWQGALFKYALDRRHNPETATIPESLQILQRNKVLRQTDDLNLWLDPEFLNSAGVTWENVLSAVGPRVDKAKLWEALIPSMGYMALIRNLRNFDEAGISNQAANRVVVKLVQEDEVKRSRQLPFRFLSAYKNAPSLRWGHALETALDISLPNIPVLPGRTLILTDTSGSMTNLVSDKSSVRILEAAGLFAVALARRNQGQVDLYQYADHAALIGVPKGGSTLRVVSEIAAHANSVGYGTNIEGSVRQTYDGHDRVVILTDAQGCNYGSVTAQGVGAQVPSQVPVYLFNVESHTASPMPTGNAARFDLGGLTDATFALIPRLEAGLTGGWPWETRDDQR